MIYQQIHFSNNSIDLFFIVQKDIDKYIYIFTKFRKYHKYILKLYFKHIYIYSKIFLNIYNTFLKFQENKFPKKAFLNLFSQKQFSKWKMIKTSLTKELKNTFIPQGKFLSKPRVQS